MLKTLRLYRIEKWKREEAAETIRQQVYWHKLDTFDDRRLIRRSREEIPGQRI